MAVIKYGKKIPDTNDIFLMLWHYDIFLSGVLNMFKL